MLRLLCSAALVLLVPTASTSPQLLMPDASTDHVPMAEVALAMTSRFIADYTNTLIILEKCQDCKRGDYFHWRLLEHFLIQFRGALAVQLLYAQSGDRPWDYNVFIIDSEWAFEELRFHFPPTLHERQFYFFIILTVVAENTRKRDETMIRIFETCTRFNVYNVVIMSQYPDGTFGFFTFRLFGPNHCFRIVDVDEFNRYRNGVLVEDRLFPTRVTNLYNCSLHVCAHIYYPLLSFYGNTSDPRHLRECRRLTGIDGDVLKILAESMNFSIILQIPDVVHKMGSHHNSTGCYKELENNRADIVIGGLHSYNPKNYLFSVSTTYHQSPLVFVVRSGLHFGPLKQLANPFNWEVWCLIGVTQTIATFFIRAVDAYGGGRLRDFVFGERNNSPLLLLVVVFLGNPIVRVPRLNFARFLLMSWMLLTLILRNAYQGKMYDALRVSRRIPIPHRIADLIDRKYLLLSYRYEDFYPQNLTVLTTHMSRRFGAVQAKSGAYATVAVLDSLAYFNRHNWNSSRLTYVDEPIYVSQLVMYFAKHSIFKFAFNHKIKQLIDFGITNKIAKTHMNERFQNMNTGSYKVTQINYKMLRGLYSGFVILNVVALQIFALENLSRRSLRVRRILDWIH